MGEDYAIKYNAKLMEVKNNIELLEKTNLKIESFNDIINKIEVELKEQIKKSYESFDNNISSKTFLYDAVGAAYSKAIDKLDKINDYLMEEYNSYYRVESIYEDIETRISSLKEKTYDREISDDAILLLKSLNKTTSINYEEEKNLVEKVYNLIYKIIKLELLYSTDNTLFDYIKTNNIDSIYISKLIKEEINNFSDKEEINKVIKRITKYGLDAYSYVDKDLIMALLDANNIESKMKILDSKLYMYIEDEKKLESEKATKIEISNNLSKKMKEKKSLVLYKIKKIGAAIFPTAIFLAGGILIGSHGTYTYETYKTTTETFDTLDSSYNKDVEYKKETKNKIEIVETTPWIKDREDYRFASSSVNVYTLDDSYLNTEDIREYLNDKEKYILMKSNNNFKNSSNLTKAEENQKLEYQITRVIQDKNDCVEKKDKFNIGLMIIYALLASAFDSAIIYVLIYMRFLDFKETNLSIDELTSKIDIDNETMKNVETKIKKLISDLNLQKDDILSIYDSLPSFVKEDEDIKEKILKLTPKM